MMPAFATPLSTVWPAIVAAVLLAGSLLLSRRSLRLPRGWLAVASAAIFVRLVLIPVLTAHTFDGHEADYFDIFRGIAEPTRGGTVKVPAMQWFWWLIGQPFSAAPPDHGVLRVVPVLLMSVISVTAIGALGGAIGVLAGRRAGWTAAALLVVHPVHAAWSSSAYNVMLPHALGCLSLFALALALKRPGAPRSLGWVAAAAAALAVSMRLDTATLGLALVSLPLLVRGSAWRRLLLPGVAGLLLAALAIWPLVWPGELPGSGERSLAFAVNIGMLDFYAPFDSWPGLLLLGALCVAAIRAHPRLSLALIPLSVANHLIMASFDDFGARHTLPALVSIAFVVGAGSQAMGRWGWLVILAPLGMAAHLTQGLGERYYGDEAAYRALLDQPPTDALPRWEWPADVPESCGWVVEDHRVRRGDVASHFNLLQPDEEARLRGADGCLLWCKDVQDWRWSSRGVGPRAQRLEHLFDLVPRAVVVEPKSGYACLAQQVGERRIRAEGTDTSR
jgi:hypothetical protein